MKKGIASKSEDYEESNTDVVRRSLDMDIGIWHGYGATGRCGVSLDWLSMV